MVARTVGTRAASDEDFPDIREIVEDLVNEPESEPEPQDPALLAAASMLAGAFDKPSTEFDAAAKSGAVLIVLAPCRLWAPYLLRALPGFLQETPFARMQVPSRPMHRPDRWSSANENPTWLLPSESHHAKEDTDGLAEALWSGRGVACVTHDASFVPEDIRDAADVTIEVAAPGADVLLAASTACTDGPQAWPFGEPQVAPTPGMVRSAFRAGGAAADAFERMRRALESVSAKAASRPTEKPRWTLDRLHGMTEVTAWGRQLAADIAAWRAGSIGWHDVDGGAMLVGPPGTGKTTVARAIADAAGLRFLPTSYLEWEGGKSGGCGTDIARRMRAVFTEAKREPTLLFLDEADTMPTRGNTAHNSGWWDAIVNGLLALLDGAEDRGNVVVVGAANSVDRMDPALLRPGRLDRILRVPLPDRAALASIAMEHVPELTAEDARVLARRMAGGTGADVAQIARDGRRRARTAGRPVALADLLAGVLDDARTAYERRVAAIHESGHAVAFEAIRPGCLLSVSIVDRDGAGGGVETEPSPRVQPLAAIETRCVAILAGRAAEEVCVGVVHSGAGGSPDSDLALATGELVRARTALGLCGELVWRGHVVDAERAGTILALRPDMALWVEDRLQELYGRARELVASRETEVEALAAALLEHESLDGDEARAVLAGVSRGRVAA